MEIKVWVLAGACSVALTIIILGMRLFLNRFNTQIDLLSDIKSGLAVQKKENEHIKEDIKEIKEEQKEHSERIRKLEIGHRTFN